MDLCAELTLQIAGFLQSEPAARRSPTRWGFVPGPVGPRTAVREQLVASEKPVGVGVLHEPGFLALWRVASLTADERRRVEHQVANQQRYLDELLAQAGVGDDAIVVFESWVERFALPVAELRRWVREYMVVCGWTIGEPTDATHHLRLLVLHGNRHWSPGSVCPIPDGGG